MSNGGAMQFEFRGKAYVSRPAAKCGDDASTCGGCAFAAMSGRTSTPGCRAAPLEPGANWCGVVWVAKGRAAA